MKKFYSDSDHIKLHQIKALLDEANIPTFLKNEYLQGAIGELPAVDVGPEIWLVDQSFEDQANKIILDYETQIMSATDSWICSHCAEVNEPQFMVCWQCQHSK